MTMSPTGFGSRSLSLRVAPGGAAKPTVASWKRRNSDAVDASTASVCDQAGKMVTGTSPATKDQPAAVCLDGDDLGQHRTRPRCTCRSNVWIVGECGLVGLEHVWPDVHHCSGIPDATLEHFWFVVHGTTSTTGKPRVCRAARAAALFADRHEEIVVREGRQDEHVDSGGGACSGRGGDEARRLERQADLQADHGERSLEGLSRTFGRRAAVGRCGDQRRVRVVVEDREVTVSERRARLDSDDIRRLRQHALVDCRR